ncbi:substrate-binding domain-containing protein [Iocasia frigidifontis]|uniref:Substrate-binding domain-containing protein n=1 Tax=Iocasia fonsfrigidae TaxID=2682810 RepID=A0A8A7KF17_9FIRM|nr:MULTISPECIES: sugar ABC transporter substrate-binding protein [Halanaerobiaceae]AZO93814.1 sugar ABC transporter substrate-binding protein [Halocella sp. SP3-1]QTL96754.1 substrate-binding domain-containing protein [Iocasia fonsfrigidae]
MKKLFLLSLILIVVISGMVMAAGKKEVAMISPALTSTFYLATNAGATEVAEELGWDLYKLAPDRESNFQKQVSMVEDMIQREVDAIALCAINDKAVVSAVKKANEAGIPVFVFNSLTELPGGKVEAYVGYDQRAGGRKVGLKAVDLLHSKYGELKGKIVILEGVPGYHTTERKGGFMEILEKFPEIEIAASQPADWEREKGMNVTENLLQAIPDLDLVFGCSDAMAQGAAQAARSMNKDIYTIGIDGNPDAIEDVSKDRLTGTLAVFPTEMGRITIRAIKDYFDGKDVPQFIKTPTEIVDEDNWDTIE